MNEITSSRNSSAFQTQSTNPADTDGIQRGGSQKYTPRSTSGVSNKAEDHAVAAAKKNSSNNNEYSYGGSATGSRSNIADKVIVP